MSSECLKCGEHRLDCKCNKIKSCPFCQSNSVGFVPSLMGAQYIECHDCWAHGPIIGNNSIENKPAKEKARKAWNRRK